MLFLMRFAIINALIILTIIGVLWKSLPDPLSSKTYKSLEQNMDVLGAQTSIDEVSLSRDVSNHNLSTDCWIKYDGKTYDITTLLSIDTTFSQYCGQDVTQAFDDKDNSVSSFNSVDTRRMIAQFQIQ